MCCWATVQSVLLPPYTNILEIGILSYSRVNQVKLCMRYTIVHNYPFNKEIPDYVIAPSTFTTSTTKGQKNPQVFIILNHTRYMGLKLMQPVPWGLFNPGAIPV